MQAEAHLDTILSTSPLESPAAARIIRGLCEARRLEEATAAVARYLLRNGIVAGTIPPIVASARAETVQRCCAEAVQAYHEQGGVLIEYVPKWALASNMVTLWAGGAPRQAPVTVPLRGRLPEKERRARDIAAVLRVKEAVTELEQAELLHDTGDAYSIPKEKMERVLRHLTIAALMGFDATTAAPPLATPEAAL
jgi:hypothetical protein